MLAALVFASPYKMKEDLDTLLNPSASEKARVKAAKAVGKSKEPAALEALAQVLGTTSESLRFAAVETLKQHQAGPYFAQRLEDGKSPAAARMAAARTLRHLKDLSTSPALGKCLTGAPDEVRSECAHALAVFGAVDQVAPLQAALKDPSKDVRYFAVLALEQVPAAREALKLRQKEEPDALVRDELSRILGP